MRLWPAGGVVHRSSNCNEKSIRTGCILSAREHSSSPYWMVDPTIALGTTVEHTGWGLGACALGTLNSNRTTMTIEKQRMGIISGSLRFSHGFSRTEALSDWVSVETGGVPEAARGKLRVAQGSRRACSSSGARRWAATAQLEVDRARCPLTLRLADDE